MIHYIYYHSSIPELDNEKVLEVIKSCPGWAILSPSFFLVRIDEDKTSVEGESTLQYIKKKLEKVCSSSDEFFIGQMGGSGATWQGYGIRLKNWIIENSHPQKEDEDDSTIEEDVNEKKEEKNGIEDTI